ncbi:MAG: dihydrolipoamide acetyltransferase family protein [bacterium]
MATNVIMPALGMAQETGKVLQWLKGEGAAIAKGEPLLEIETDKATVELEAPASGVLARITASAGDVVPVGRVIAQILAVGETPTGESPPEPPAPSVPTAVPGLPLPSAAAPGPPVEMPAAVEDPRSASGPAAGESRKVGASPMARWLARERGVDLAHLSGSGPGGAVVAADIGAHAGRAQPPAQASAISTVWRLMAERTARSWTTVPHFFLLREVDASGLEAWYADMRKRFGKSITYTDLLVKITAVALRDHPRVNAKWEAGGIVYNDAINLSVAVATSDALVAPVIHDADRLTVRQIAERRSDLVGRAQAGKLRPDDLQGGTFTISNLGMYAVDAFTAIINAPQAAILAVGRIAERVVAVSGQPAVRPMIAFSLSCDHRVVDGARGALFLERLAALIEEPASLVE